MRLILLFIVLSVAVSFSQQAGKAYILSEGGFSAGSAKLSMLNNYTGSFADNIFSPGTPGLYPDGLIYHNGYLYMCEQGSYGAAGKVYKIDTNGTVINSKVCGLNPYSIAIANDKIFLTNGPAGNVTVLNLGDLTEIATVPVGVYPQEILAAGNKVFVANTSVYGGAEDRTVSVIDAVNNSHVKKITVRKDPSSLALSRDGFLLVSCPGDGNNGIIYKINTDTYTIVDSFFAQTEGVSKDIAVDPNSSKIYFIGYSGNIVEMDLATRQTTAVITGTPGTNYYYGYSYDHIGKKHYVLDAKSFMVSGSMYVYNSSGILLNTYTTGTAPRRVLLKYDSGISVVQENLSGNERMAVSVYPNPFKENTNIMIQTGREGTESKGNVSLKIYNVMGELTSTLIDGPVEGGRTIETFNASDLPPGIYFCELSCNGKRVTAKMILMR